MQAGIVFIAWRCLYAEIVYSRVEEAPMRIDRAYNRVWQMTITRLRAEGEKWRLWHKINVGSGKRSYFPEKFQNRRVIVFTETAEYTINSSIFEAYDVSLKDMRGSAGELPVRAIAPATQAPAAGAKRPAPSASAEGKRKKGPSTFVPVPFRGTGPTTQTTLTEHFGAAASPDWDL